MNTGVQITTLVENTAGLPGLLAEHGLSFLVQTGERNILFDTGAGDTLCRNAQVLGVDLSKIDTLVLSHGHYDHTGAVAAVLDAAPETLVYVHPEAFAPKYSKKQDGIGRYIGVPAELKPLYERKTLRMQENADPTGIGDGFFLTGAIPRVTDFEDTGGSFFFDEECTRPDPLVDDQALFFTAPQGTVVILGCAHSGVINTLNYIRQLTGGKPIHAVMGGMHLCHAGMSAWSGPLRLCGNSVYTILHRHTAPAWRLPHASGTSSQGLVNPVRRERPSDLTGRWIRRHILRHPNKHMHNP